MIGVGIDIERGHVLCQFSLKSTVGSETDVCIGADVTVIQLLPLTTLVTF